MGAPAVPHVGSIGLHRAQLLANTIAILLWLRFGNPTPTITENCWPFLQRRRHPAASGSLGTAGGLLVRQNGHGGRHRPAHRRCETFQTAPPYTLSNGGAAKRRETSRAIGPLRPKPMACKIYYYFQELERQFSSFSSARPAMLVPIGENSCATVPWLSQQQLFWPVLP